MSEKLRLLVYGTLRRGQFRHEVLPTEKGKMELTTLGGYTMVALPYGFPGVYETSDPADKVVVELWEFDLSKKEREKLIARLDAIEGVDQGMYNREVLEMPDGTEAFLYTCNLPAKGKVIKDWDVFTAEQSI